MTSSLFQQHPCLVPSCITVIAAELIAFNLNTGFCQVPQDLTGRPKPPIRVDDRESWGLAKCSLTQTQENPNNKPKNKPKKHNNLLTNLQPTARRPYSLTKWAPKQARPNIPPTTQFSVVFLEVFRFLKFFAVFSVSNPLPISPLRLPSYGISTRELIPHHGMQTLHVQSLDI